MKKEIKLGCPMEYEVDNIIHNGLFLRENEVNIVFKELEKLNKQKEILDKIKEKVNEMPYLWYADEEIERIDGTIELKYKEYDTSKLEELLEEIE